MIWYGNLLLPADALIFGRLVAVITYMADTAIFRALFAAPAPPHSVPA